MSSDQIFSFIRHALTLLGGIFVTRGWIDEQSLSQIVGAVATLLGFAWSAWTHTLSSK